MLNINIKYMKTNFHTKWVQVYNHHESHLFVKHCPAGDGSTKAPRALSMKREIHKIII